MPETSIVEPEEVETPEDQDEEEEDEPELDLENPHVQQVMRSNSTEIQELVLANTMVFALNETWTLRDGETPAFPLYDKATGKQAVDDKGKPLFLKVGAIFFIEESVTTVQDEKLKTVNSTRLPAHYEVWTEPNPVMRRRRIFLDQVIYADEAVPLGWAADQIMTDRMPDCLVIDVDEVLEEAQKLEAANGSSAAAP